MGRSSQPPANATDGQNITCLVFLLSSSSGAEPSAPGRTPAIQTQVTRNRSSAGNDRAVRAGNAREYRQWRDSVPEGLSARGHRPDQGRRPRRSRYRGHRSTRTGMTGKSVPAAGGRSLVRKWRAVQDKSANTYVFEVAL